MYQDSSQITRLIALGDPDDNEHDAIANLNHTLDPDWIIFHSRRPFQGRPNLDVLIVAPHGIFIAELKYYRDTMTIGNASKWRRRLSDGSVELLPNMLQSQAQKQAQQLKTEFKAAGLKHLWIEPVVIFTHNSSILEFESHDSASLQQVVFCLKDAKVKFEALVVQNKQKLRPSITRSDLEKIAELFDKMHMLPSTKGWSEEYVTVMPAAKSDERLARLRRRRINQIKTILVLVSALIVVLTVYTVIIKNNY
jgi:Nuclease-related domain